MTYNKNSHQQVQTIARTSPAIANPLGARKMPIIEKINPNNRKTMSANGSQNNNIDNKESVKPALPKLLLVFLGCCSCTTTWCITLT